MNGEELATNCSNFSRCLGGRGGHGGSSTSSSKTLGFAVAFSFASGTLSLIGATFNFIVMVLLTKYMRFNQNTHLYIFSLSLSDFLYNVVFQIPIICRQFPGVKNPRFSTAILKGESLTLLVAGSFSLLLVSVDRYLTIKYPFRYSIHVTKTKTIATVCCIWLFAVILGVLNSLRVPVVSKNYIVLLAVILVLTFLIQILIFAVAHHQAKSIQQLNRSLEHNYPRPEHGVYVAPANQTSTRHTKATKTIGLMLAMYVFSWLPATLYRLQYRMFGGNSRDYHKWLVIVTTSLQLHACVNPFIYVLRTKEAKLAMQSMLRDCGMSRFSSYILGNPSSAATPVIEVGTFTQTSNNSNAVEIAVATNAQSSDSGKIKVSTSDSSNTTSHDSSTNKSSSRDKVSTTTSDGINTTSSNNNNSGNNNNDNKSSNSNNKSNNDSRDNGSSNNKSNSNNNSTNNNSSNNNSTNKSNNDNSGNSSSNSTTTTSTSSIDSNNSGSNNNNNKSNSNSNNNNSNSEDNDRKVNFVNTGYALSCGKTVSVDKLQTRGDELPAVIE